MDVSIEISMVKLRMDLWRHQFSKIQTEKLKDFPLKVFIASLGLLGRFFGPLGDLVSNIIKKGAYRKPKKASRKPQRSYKNWAKSFKFFGSHFGKLMISWIHSDLTWPLASLGKHHWDEVPCWIVPFGRGHLGYDPLSAIVPLPGVAFNY